MNVSMQAVSIEGMTSRDYDIVDLSNLVSEVPFPDRLVVQCDDKHRVDIGSICYLYRENLAVDRKKKSSICNIVNFDSLREERKEFVRACIDYVITKGYRALSAYERLDGIVSIVKWADLNCHWDFLLNEKAATRFYKSYVDHLKHRVLVEGTINPTSAAACQRTAVLIMNIQFGIESTQYIVRKVPFFENQKKTGTEAPRKKDIEHYVHVIKTLAQQLSSQLMSDRTFPLHLKFKDFETYVFQGRGRNIKTPYSVPPIELYDFDEGRLATMEELLERRPQLRVGEASAQIRDALGNFAKSHDKHCSARSRLTVLAVQCYAILFQMITGANPSQLVDLEVSEALEIINSPIKREFTAVKFRANGKEVKYTVGNKVGVKLLEEYLRFRSWILEDLEFKYLFFEYSSVGRKSRLPQKLRVDFQSRVFERKLKGFYLPSSFKNITPSKARISKSVTLHELGLNPSLVSDSLQHTEKVNGKSYTSVTLDRASEEFGKYWASVAEASERYRIIDGTTLNVMPTASGECDGYRNPEPISNTVPIQPDCDKQYGCLYCVHYCCHADKEDVHKLLSLKYVLSEVGKYAKDVSHADSLLRELCVRASLIVNKISEISVPHKEMVSLVEHNVFELGILTPFWELRLSRYEKLGVVI